jgi:uncharacterized protein YndB with AHSA1/START domain
MLDVRSTSAARTVRAPRQQVWRALTDLGGLRRDVGHVADFELLTPGDFGDGTRWRETRRVGRHRAVLTMTVESAVASEGYVATGTIGSTEARLSFHLVEQGPQQTEVVATLEYQAPAARSVLHRVWATTFGTPAGRHLRRELEDELTRVEHACQQRARS